MFLVDDIFGHLISHLLLLLLINDIWESQVPVANGSGSYPFSVDVPRNTRFLFSNRTTTPAKAIAKSIVR